MIFIHMRHEITVIFRSANQLVSRAGLRDAWELPETAREQVERLPFHSDISERGMLRKSISIFATDTILI